MTRWPMLAAAMTLAVSGCTGHGARLTLPTTAPFAEQVHDPRWAAAAAKARPVLEAARCRHGLPSLSVALVIDGKPAWSAATGWADVAAATPAGPQTRYRLGSTSKAVTATVLARLVDQGTMTLDAPIGTWLATLPNPAWPALTPRQLASHTAGIVDYDQNRDLVGLYHSVTERRQFDTVREALSVFDGNRLAYPPGRGFRYTSFDVVLLSAAMEGATSLSYSALLDREISAPLHLTSLSPDYQDRPVPDRAAFYWRDDAGVKRWRAVNHSYKWAAGGLVATSNDLARIGAAWFDPGFIHPETRTAFWTPQPLADGTPNPQAYAIGWRANSNRQLLGPDQPVWNVHHGGVSKGAYSWLNLYPELGVVVALNSNARLDDFADFIAIEQEITRIFIGRGGEAVVTSDGLASCSGPGGRGPQPLNAGS